MRSADHDRRTGARNDVSINIGGATGHFERMVFKPMMIYNFLHSAG